MKHLPFACLLALFLSSSAAPSAEKPDPIFILADDPYEKKDLSASQPAKLKALRSRYDALAAQAVPPKNRPE